MDTTTTAPKTSRSWNGQCRIRSRKIHRSPLAIPFLAFLLLNFLSFSASAQTTTSTIEGTVTDANGGVIAGATVKATGKTLATERVVTTDSDGFFRLAGLPAGTYTVTISQTGFG